MGALRSERGRRGGGLYELSSVCGGLFVPCLPLRLKQAFTCIVDRWVRLMMSEWRHACVFDLINYVKRLALHNLLPIHHQACRPTIGGTSGPNAVWSLIRTRPWLADPLLSINHWPAVCQNPSANDWHASETPRANGHPTAGAMARNEPEAPRLKSSSRLLQARMVKPLSWNSAAESQDSLLHAGKPPNTRPPLGGKHKTPRAEHVNECMRGACEAIPRRSRLSWSCCRAGKSGQSCASKRHRKHHEHSRGRT